MVARHLGGEHPGDAPLSICFASVRSTPGRFTAAAGYLASSRHVLRRRARPAAVCVERIVESDSARTGSLGSPLGILRAWLRLGPQWQG